MKPGKKIKSVRPNRIEKAILMLAELMEEPLHDQYQIKKRVMQILGFSPLPPKRKGKKK